MSSRAFLGLLAASVVFATTVSAASFPGHFGGGAHTGARSGGPPNVGGSSPRPAASFGRGGGESRFGMPPASPHGAPGFVGSSPRPAASFGNGGAAARMGAPPAGHHGAPGFNGASPRGAPLGASPRLGGARRGQFRGRSYDQFTADDRARWSHGDWRHGWRHGHYGSWWVVDGLWFFYDEPVYPYPAYVGWEDGGDGDGPAQAYYCEDPPGYYPDVQACNLEWEGPPGE